MHDDAAEPAHEGAAGFQVAVDVLRIGVVLREHGELAAAGLARRLLDALAPNIEQHLRRDHETEEARAVHIEDLRGRLGGRIQRHIGNPQPLLG